MCRGAPIRAAQFQSDTIQWPLAVRLRRTLPGCRFLCTQPALCALATVLPALTSI